MATIVLSALSRVGAAETPRPLEPASAILAERAAERAPTRDEGASAPRRRAVDCARRLKRRERVVVIGAGFGGLSAAKGLIRARLRGSNLPRFRYHDYGSLATIGRKRAVVDMGIFRVTGFIARMIWSIAHIYFLIGFRNRAAVALNWVWNYLTFQRGARLITGPVGSCAPPGKGQGSKNQSRPHGRLA